jgi:hypothetical protein
MVTLASDPVVGALPPTELVSVGAGWPSAPAGGSDAAPKPHPLSTSAAIRARNKTERLHIEIALLFYPCV